MELSQVVQDIRVNWAKADAKRDEGLTTPADIERQDDITYGPHGTDNLLDVYRPKGADGKLPTIVNIHGGGWVYGCKEIYQFYCMSLAQRGFAVVNINYRLAPENRFPAAVEDIHAAMNWIAENGAAYGIDKDRLVMIGDSAGGQLVSHYATILTNSDFAALFGFSAPAVTVKAVGLYCGCYDGREMALNGSDEVFAEYVNTISQAPTEELLQRLDALSYMTGDFPAAFVMSSMEDFLLPAAEPMARKLESLQVPCELKIYGEKGRPEIGHVFHVNIQLPEATQCNDDACAFFRKYV